MMEKFLAEFIGTALLILFGNGVVANTVLAKSKGNGGGWICISAGWGFGVALAVYAVGHVSGAHINPAVTLNAVVNLGMPLAEGAGYVIAQIIGAMLGSTLVFLMYRDHYNATDDPATKQATFCTAPAIRNTPVNFLTEFIATAAMVFCIAAIAVPANETGPAQAPMLVGILIFAIGLSLGGPTGYAINPARDLGPRIMHALLPIKNKGGSGWDYAWLPVVAPLLGGVFGGWLFMLTNLGAAPAG